jgi:hypothetical protein
MSKSEKDFLRTIEAKAREERNLAESELMPEWARGLGEWLVVNPWRVLVPLAAAGYLLLRVVYGATYREFILGLFGGFP